MKISNNSEDEYSLFIISTSSKSFLNYEFYYFVLIEYSSRVLNSTEYFFDILNEYTRLNIINYHFIIKRILWFDLSLQFSDMFIDFMYHQLISILFEGTIILLNNNYHLSEELIVIKNF